MKKPGTRSIKQMLRDPRPVGGGSLDDLYNDKTALQTKGDVARAHRDGMRAAMRESTRNLRSQSMPEIYGEIEGDAKTPGQIFIESDVYKDLVARGGGGSSSSAEHRSAPVAISGGLRTMTTGAVNAIKARAPITGASGSAGALTQTQHLPGVTEGGLLRPLTLRQLVTVMDMQADTIDYIKEATRGSNAAPVSDPTQFAHIGDETATKPEGGLTFTTVSVSAKLIAEWVAVHTSLLADAPYVRGYIDDTLIYDLDLELEDQMLAGTGTGQDFLGILNTAGTQTVTPFDSTTTAGPLDNIRKGITLVEINGRTRPNAVALNPVDMQTIELTKENNEKANYITDPFTAGPRAVWGIPVVTSTAIPAGTALVGDFKMATLFDRMEAHIQVGTVGDDFIRNLRRILAEMRAGFGVRRPQAFCEVALTGTP